jgi:hypothetical protein
MLVFQVMVSIQSALITIPINTIIIMLFKNSRPKPISFEQKYAKTMKVLGKNEDREDDIEQAQEVRGPQEQEYMEEIETEKFHKDRMDSRSSRKPSKESMKMKDIQKYQNGSTRDKYDAHSVRTHEGGSRDKYDAHSVSTYGSEAKDQCPVDSVRPTDVKPELKVVEPQPHRRSFKERMLPGLSRARRTFDRTSRKPETTEGEPRVADLAAEEPRQPHRRSFMERMLPGIGRARSPASGHPSRDSRTRGPPPSDSRTRGPPSRDSRSRGPPPRDPRTRGPSPRDSRTRGPLAGLTGQDRGRQPDNRPPERTNKKAFSVRPERQRRMTFRDSIVEGMKYINENMSNINLWQDNSSDDSCLMDFDYQDILADSDSSDGSKAQNMNMNNLFGLQMNKQSDKKVSENAGAGKFTKIK